MGLCWGMLVSNKTCSLQWGMSVSDGSQIRHVGLWWGILVSNGSLFRHVGLWWVSNRSPIILIISWTCSKLKILALDVFMSLIGEKLYFKFWDQHIWVNFFWKGLWYFLKFEQSTSTRWAGQMSIWVLQTLYLGPREKSYVLSKLGSLAFFLLQMQEKMILQ